MLSIIVKSQKKKKKTQWKNEKNDGMTKTFIVKLKKKKENKRKREKNKKGFELILINLFQDRARITFPRIKVVSSLINKNVHFLLLYSASPSFPPFSSFLLLLSLILSLIKTDQRGNALLSPFFFFFYFFRTIDSSSRNDVKRGERGKEGGGGLNDERERSNCN